MVSGSKAGSVVWTQRPQLTPTYDEMNVTLRANRLLDRSSLYLSESRLGHDAAAPKYWCYFRHPQGSHKWLPAMVPEPWDTRCHPEKQLEGMWDSWNNTGCLCFGYRKWTLAAEGPDCSAVASQVPGARLLLQNECRNLWWRPPSEMIFVLPSKFRWNVLRPAAPIQSLKSYLGSVS